MASIKRDDVKQKWEETEFPLVCETCLGDNPYVRMTKEPHGKACKICETPFTVFAWQAGTRGRLKKVEICQTCARTKNVCQVCIFDLQYGLPVQLRDKVLREEGSGRDAMALTVPQSDANRSWFNAQHERAIAEGTAGAHPTTMRAAIKLQSMARMEPRYERNLAKICSFYAKGECNRGSNCPFRHEMPKDRNDPLSKQNTKDRFYGTNDPVAERMMGRQRERAEKRREDAKARGDQEEGDERAVSTCYVRFDDRNESTNGIKLTEMDIRDAFYSFGEISSVRMHIDKGVFVEYTTGDAAELAIGSMNRKTIRGRMIFVNWARQPKRGNEGKLRMQQQQQQNAVGGALRPIAPPGGSTSLPKGFASLRPSLQVSAAAAARVGLGVPRPGGAAASLGVPRPGGGVIRRPAASGVRSAAPKPYYPSADPGRLGTRSAASTGNES